jgi:hypothetical protein
MYDDFGSFGWGLGTDIVQHGVADHLFGCGGIGFTVGRAQFEIQVRSSFRRIVVTSGHSYAWDTLPEPTGVTTVTLSWGWPI